jgi:hypothetical protein
MDKPTVDVSPPNPLPTPEPTPEGIVLPLFPFLRRIGDLIAIVFTVALGVALVLASLYFLIRFIKWAWSN